MPTHNGASTYPKLSGAQHLPFNSRRSPTPNLIFLPDARSRLNLQIAHQQPQTAIPGPTPIPVAPPKQATYAWFSAER